MRSAKPRIWIDVRALGERGAKLFADYERELVEKRMSRDVSAKPR